MYRFCKPENPTQVRNGAPIKQMITFCTLVIFAGLILFFTDWSDYLEEYSDE